MYICIRQVQMAGSAIQMKSKDLKNYYSHNCEFRAAVVFAALLCCCGFCCYCFHYCRSSWPKSCCRLSCVVRDVKDRTQKISHTHTNTNDCTKPAGIQSNKKSHISATTTFTRGKKKRQSHTHIQIQLRQVNEIFSFVCSVVR